MINTSNPTYSCRYYKTNNKNYKISLSESHNIAFSNNDSYHFDRTKKIFNLEEKDIIDRYSNVDIISHDYIPYVGSIKENLFISTGYNTWGMTNSIIIAKIISHLIDGKYDQYIKMLNPLRKNFAFFSKLPLHIFYSTISYLKSKINKRKKWYSNNITFYKENGKSLAKYKDDKKIEHIIYNKCPHLGCSLIFNEQEKSWDCPCHSSRFDIDGKYIKGPSLYDITYKKNK